MLIRDARPADLPAVAEIYAHYVLTSTATFEEVPPTEADWRARFDTVGSLGLPFLVGELDGRVAGYAYCGTYRPRPAYRHTVENSIYLAATATGQGLGGALLRRLVEGCVERDVRQIIAVVADGPAASASLALHRRHGFTDAGRLVGVGHKHGQWLDTILMQRAL
ncbi:N-acetyltransferase family protein [Solihabitans fulvus]|uniref:N-acetyltransferase family protein n=1 Tax=Solihabitans fulvus TaxID=1892852 RepID=A0A5B2WPJ7_9PSEU|nr:GNAT family N-acetyltransferase [Solihabitans fulvus]KAA2253883.1 N-acetyltransferase family protein [Solihabitans fulvus]